MTLVETIRSDLTKAMKQGDDVRRSTLRLLLASIKNAEIDKHGELTDPEVLTLLGKEAKKRRESIEYFEQAKRDDLVAKEQSELEIINGYLPEQMGRGEIEALARKVIAEVSAAGPGDKGKVMAQLMPQVKGKADGKEVNDAVTELLNAL